HVAIRSVDLVALLAAKIGNAGSCVLSRARLPPSRCPTRQIHVEDRRHAASEVAATAIHPLSGSPLWQCRLASGTQIEGADDALQKAHAQGIEAVLVRVL